MNRYKTKITVEVTVSANTKGDALKKFLQASKSIRVLLPERTMVISTPAVSTDLEEMEF